MSKENSFEVPLYSIEDERPPPPTKDPYTTEERSRLSRLVQRISISSSVSITYALVLSLACEITVGLILFLSHALPMDVKIWVGSVIGVLILSLQIMLLIYCKDPVFSIHFQAILMLFTDIGFALSGMHLYFQ
jgi:hypothetical protein